MMRLFSILLLIVGLMLGGSWLMQHPGEVTVVWLGYEIGLHIAAIASLLVVLILLTAFISVLLWKLASWPARRKLRIENRTLKRGLEQVTRGVTALAMGDEDAAEEALKKALVSLPGQPLPQLLHAQLLQRQGKQSEAQLQFRSLMAHPATAELATRRLIEQHLEGREWTQALSLIEEARKTSPNDRWLVVSLLNLHARLGESAAMLALTEGWQWQSPLEKSERHHFSAIAHLLAAETAATPRARLVHLRHAVGYAPDFMPATRAYGQALMTEDSPRRARKLLLPVWRKQPSSYWIPLILESVSAEDADVQPRLLKPFLRGESSVPALLLTARQAMAVEEFTRARLALMDTIALEENQEALRLLAEIEQEIGNNETAARWVSRALAAPQGDQWICHSCGTSHAAWHTHCTHCHSFDTLKYERPETRITTLELGN